MFSHPLLFSCLRTVLLCLAALLVSAWHMAAKAAEPGLAPVTVTATRDPVEKSYRKMLQGMEVFERLHALAPQARLRYKLLPRQPGTPLDGMVLKVVGDSVTLNVPVAADHTFTLERNQRAMDEDAQVIPNRKTRSMTWRTDIRTPGLPANTRRLGDLRLECEVGVAANLLSENLPLLGTLNRVLSGAQGICRSSPTRYLLFADKPVFSVTMVHGARRQTMPVNDLYLGQFWRKVSANELAHSDAQALVDRTYALPLADASWPDDTLIEFEWMEEGA